LKKDRNTILSKMSTLLFDKMYNPDYICSEMMDVVIGKIKEGLIADILC